MGDDYSPPGTVRLTSEIDRRFSDDVGPAFPTVPSDLLPDHSRRAKRSCSGKNAAGPFDPFGLTDKSLVDVMAAVRAGQAAEEDVRRREAEVAARRRRVWGPLRIELATEKRRGWWWFHDFDGQTEAIPPHWWNSSAAEDAASHGVTTVMRTIGASAHPSKAVVVIDEAKIHTAPVVVTSNIIDETEARKYIVGLMMKTPVKPSAMTNKVLFADVKKQCPNLSWRAFERAKAAAIEATGAVDWKAPGK